MEDFTNVFGQLVPRHGTPNDIQTDFEENFPGAENKLKKAALMNDNQLMDKLS